MAEKNRITPESLFKFKYVSDPQISPDGRFTAFTVKTADEDENSYKSDIYLLDSENNVIKLTAGGDAGSFFWDSDGSVIFSAVREKKDKEATEAGDEQSVFYRISPQGGEAEKFFTVAANVCGIKPLDGRRYVMMCAHNDDRPDTAGLSDSEKAQALKEYKEKPYTRISEWPFWHNGGSFTERTRTAIYIYDRESGSMTQVSDKDNDVSDFDADAGLIVYMAGPFRKGIRSYIFEGVYVYDIASGETHCAVKPGEMFISAAGVFSGGAFIAATDGSKYGTEEYPDTYYYDIVAGKLTLLHEFDAAVGYSTVGSDARLGGGNGIKADGDKIYFITTADDGAYLLSIDKKGNMSAPLTPVHGSCDSFDVKDGRVIYCGLYGSDIAELYEDGSRLTDLGGVSGFEVSVPEELVFMNNDGCEIKGWVMKPLGFKENEKYPAILNIHGGPRTVFGSVFHQEMQLWAASGYFVLFCNPRGSDGKGSEFGYISGKYGSIDYDDIMSFADEALKKHPQINAQRVGVGGGSYGGFMTNWIIGHTQRFAAAVSQRSIANWTVFEHTTDIGIDFTESQMLTNTRKDSEKLWRLSPLKYAPECRTPTLFIHSDCDYRCWMSEGLSMFTALKMNGCDTELCLFKGENHDLSRSGKPKARIARMSAILAWYDKYLKDKE